MNKSLAIALGLALALLAGCRREDVREFAEPYPELTDAKMGKVKAALKRYEGVQLKTMELKNGILRLKYDSMQLAKENIRREVEAFLK